MAGKISELVSGSPAGAILGTDAFEITRDPSGTPLSMGGIISALRTYVLSFFTSFPFDMIKDVGDETTNITVGAGKSTFRMPRAVTISKIKGSLTTAATGATLFQFDVNKNGATIFSTNPTFDSSEKTTETAATPSVISGTTVNIAADDEITIDVDAVGNTTPGAGLKISFIGVYQ